ncbi:MAG TPA: helix-turn-helix domain-containing protein [Lapillicoccus sp.]|nr:helix-turn-helix domain-containing protein [Lapillicoccus sp.]
MGNLYGDVELDARGMRALAHPVRLAILTRLQNDGPSTATRLSESVGASPSVTSWHLRQLAAHGLVRDASEAASLRDHGRERWWEAVSRGFRFAAEPGESVEAARALEEVMEAVDGDIVGRWRAEAEPQLEPEWRRLAGRANTRVVVTPDEMEAIETAIEQVLAPYVLRKDTPDAQPAEARSVRLLRYTLPAAPGGDNA